MNHNLLVPALCAFYKKSFPPKTVIRRNIHMYNVKFTHAQAKTRIRKPGHHQLLKLRTFLHCPDVFKSNLLFYPGIIIAVYKSGYPAVNTAIGADHQYFYLFFIHCFFNRFNLRFFFFIHFTLSPELPLPQEYPPV